MYRWIIGIFFITMCSSGFSSYYRVTVINRAMDPASAKWHFGLFNHNDSVAGSEFSTDVGSIPYQSVKMVQSGEYILSADLPADNGITAAVYSVLPNYKANVYRGATVFKKKISGDEKNNYAYKYKCVFNGPYTTDPFSCEQTAKKRICAPFSDSHDCVSPSYLSEW